MTNTEVMISISKKSRLTGAGVLCTVSAVLLVSIYGGELTTTRRLYHSAPTNTALLRAANKGIDTTYEDQVAHALIHDEPKTKREQWDRWFSHLSLSWDPAQTNGAYPEESPSSESPNILYYHLKKTGGTSLYSMFHAMNHRYHMDTNPGFEAHMNGQEMPGHLEEFMEWKTENNGVDSGGRKKLIFISFREPIERVISHYFQNKPCPDGSGGGGAKACIAAATSGIEEYVRSCPFGENWQSHYLDDNSKKMDYVDFPLLNDRMEESLVLASMKYKVPIYDFLYVKQKVRVAKDAEKSPQQSCTWQWVEKLIPEEERAELIKCGRSCAGMIGAKMFTDEELQTIRSGNEKDIELWNDHIVPRYERIKAEIMEECEITQDDLDSVVTDFIESQKRFEAYSQQ